MLGQIERAIAELKRAVELDPVSPIIHVELGGVYMISRRYDEAIEQLRSPLEMDPEFYWAHRFLGLTLELKGATAEAIPEYQRAFEVSDDPTALAFLPSSVTIHPGDQVKWTWASSGHTATSWNGIWDSGLRNRGATFTHTFNSVGTFTYFCQLHGDLPPLYNEIGQVIVMSPTPTPAPPTGQTHPASYVASFSARLKGVVDPNGLTTNVYFQYGTTTSYGLTTAIQSKTGNTYQHVVATIGGLTARTTYHFRIVAVNSLGILYGSDRTFTTLSPTGLPVAITNPATNVASSSATLNGSVDPHGLTTNVHFQFGTTTSYGHHTENQTKTGNVYHNVPANISGLTAGTTYHFRIVATNSSGTRYGTDRTLTTQ